MIKKFNSRILVYSLSALLIAVFIYPSGNVSAAEINFPTNSNTIEASSQISSTVYRTYPSSLTPPGRIYHVETRGGISYSGYLSLVNVAEDPDAGQKFATYKGTLYAN